MEQLVGNFWIHDDGTGAVSLYERIGRNFRPLRYESEPLPDRIPFEAQQVIRQRLLAAQTDLNARTPAEVRIAKLKEALALLPAFTELGADDQLAFIEEMTKGLPSTFEPPKAETQGLPRPLSVEEQVEAANKAKADEIDRLAVAQTENMRLAERLAAQEAELAALKALLQKDATNGETQE